ncbi:MAG: hypothetical protein U0Q12_21800 [Vicinamibacterales bacterium]
MPSWLPFRQTGGCVRWLALAFVILLPAITARLYASDEVQYFSYLRSLWFDHDVSFENEYQYFYDHGIARSDGFHETFLERRTETGRRITFATLGAAILWSPFYVAVDAGVRIAHALGAGVEADGYGTPYVAAVAFGSAVYGWLSLVISLGCARAVTGRACGATWATWLATPLLFYMYVAPPMSHACSAFAVALFVWVWLRVRRDWSAAGLVALGAAAGLMTMVREQDAFVVVGVVADFVWGLVSASPVDVRRRLRAALAGVASGTLVFVPQALAYVALNGHVGPSRLVARKMTWWAPHGLQVLASPDHGLLWWTPLAGLALAGMVGLASRPADFGSPAARPDDVRRVALCGLLMAASQVYVAGSVESWTVAGAFGQRRFVGITVLLVIGVAAFLTGTARRRLAPLATAAVVASVWWNLGLMAQFGTGTMDRQRLEPARNAYYTFVTLPGELPRLAYRYVFDRSSFYRSTR